MELIKFNIALFLLLNLVMYLLHLRDVKKDNRAYPIWIPFTTSVFIQIVVNIAVIITTFFI